MSRAPRSKAQLRNELFVERLKVWRITVARITEIGALAARMQELEQELDKSRAALDAATSALELRKVAMIRRPTRRAAR